MLQTLITDLSLSDVFSLIQIFMLFLLVAFEILKIFGLTNSVTKDRKRRRW